MISKIDKRKCKKILIKKEYWRIFSTRISSDGHRLENDGFFISEHELINLTELLGVLAYAVRVDEGYIIYDLSFSHLCPNQIKTAVRFLNETYS